MVFGVELRFWMELLANVTFPLNLVVREVLALRPPVHACANPDPAG